jgi:hypothetical protein
MVAVAEQPARRGRLLSATVRYIGPIPAKDAPAVERLRFTRALGLKLAVPFVPFLVAGVIVINQAWAYIVIGVWAVIWLGNFTQLTFQIRRTR